MTIKERLKAILSASRAARNSDTEMWLIYAQKSGVGLTDHQMEVIRGMPSMETLRRTRQIIQNTEGSLRPDPQITAHRYNKYRAMKQNIQVAPPEQVLERPLIPWIDYQP